MKKFACSSWFALGVMMIGLAGCQTAPKIKTEFDRSAEFTTARTFALRPMPTNIPGVDPGIILRVGPAARDSARMAMTAKGYTEVADASKADLAVVIHGQSVPKTDITDWGFTPYYAAGWRGAYAYGMYGGSNVTVDQYDEGTLIIEVYDVKTRQMIWVGWATARTAGKTDDQAKKISEAITKILVGYPPAGSKPVAPARS